MVKRIRSGETIRRVTNCRTVTFFSINRTRPAPLFDRYLLLKLALYQRYHIKLDRGFSARMLQHGTRSKIAERAAPHLPFEEFKAESLEGLLKLLEKYKVASSKIQFSESESAHSFCQKQLIHILVPFDHYPVNKHVYREVELLYQYCPSCQLAVRVL